MNYIPEYFTFKKALPVWENGTECEPNTNLIFRAKVKNRTDTVLRIAGQMHYVVRINGNLLFEGPARCADGWNRADEFKIDTYLTNETNILTVFVEGLYATGFSAVRQKSFLCAEIEQGGEIIAATGFDGFEAIKYSERIKKTQRYSYQRPFVEAYRFDGTAEKFMRDGNFCPEKVNLSEAETKKFITRRVPFPLYTAAEFNKIETCGCVYDDNQPIKFKDRSLMCVNEHWTAYEKDELEICSSEIADKIVLTEKGRNFTVYDAGQIYSGLIEIDFDVKEKARVVIIFDEILENGRINFGRLNCCNSFVCEFEKGKYNFSSLGVFTARYIGIAVLFGKAEPKNIRIRKTEYPDNLVKKCSFADSDIQTVFNAGRESFKQNTVDILMDCPSRERAGWLCDSTFISRGEYAFTDKSLVTKNFLENFILAENFPLIPENMIPGCYPSDNDGGCPTNGYILNWALWFIVQVKEYFDFSSDRTITDGAKEVIYKILKFFEQFKNSDGLIARTRGWVLLEYSPANKFQQDICYPLNMLYSYAEKAAGEMYNDSLLILESEKIKKTVIEKSFDGKYFVDNAVYKDGVAENTGNRSEFCQYCAFFFDIADRENFADLWRDLVENAGEHGKTDLVPAAMFLGKTLRLQLLAKSGMYSEARESLKAYCLNMALRTGTLWEFDDTFASCCHGFQSANVGWLLNEEI